MLRTRNFVKAKIGIFKKFWSLNKKTHILIKKGVVAI